MHKRFTLQKRTRLATDNRVSEMKNFQEKVNFLLDIILKIGGSDAEEKSWIAINDHGLFSVIQIVNLKK